MLKLLMMAGLIASVPEGSQVNPSQPVLFTWTHSYTDVAGDPIPPEQMTFLIGYRDESGEFTGVGETTETQYLADVDLRGVCVHWEVTAIRYDSDPPGESDPAGPIEICYNPGGVPKPPADFIAPEL